MSTQPETVMFSCITKNTFLFQVLYGDIISKFIQIEK